jgi:hypothetical protein
MINTNTFHEGSISRRDTKPPLTSREQWKKRSEGGRRIPSTISKISNL